MSPAKGYKLPESEFDSNDDIVKYNKNRSFTQLRVWNDSIELYVLTSKILSSLPVEIIKLKANALDCCQSISRNIAEGYCRRGVKEYLNFLNYAIASCGEYFSCIYSFFKANQLSKENFVSLNDLHYKVENELIKLIEAIKRNIMQKK
jgi:four helix bundle protein